MPNRRNRVNGRLYRDDPTIMSYSILGEIVPFGLQKDKDGKPDLKNESRDANAYEGLIHRAALELKRNDPNHLVNAGGLLHMAPDGPVKDATGKPYWQTVWSDPAVDYVSIHKPFVLEEWGLPIDRRIPEGTGPFVFSPAYAQAYCESALKETSAAGIPISVLWQWHPGPVFDIFPGDSPDEDRIVDILTR